MAASNMSNILISPDVLLTLCYCNRITYINYNKNSAWNL